MKNEVKDFFLTESVSDLANWFDNDVSQPEMGSMTGMSINELNLHLESHSYIFKTRNKFKVFYQKALSLQNVMKLITKCIIF